MSDPHEAAGGSADQSAPADLTEDLEELVAGQPYLEDLAEGVSGIDSASSTQQHDRSDSADERLRSTSDEGPQPSAQ